MIDHSNPPSISQLREALHKAAQIRWQQNLVIQFGKLAFVMAIALATGGIVDAIVATPAGRLCGSLAFYIALFSALGWLFVRPMLKRLELIAEAMRIQRRFPEVRNTLLPAVEFSNSREPRQHGTSPAFVDQTIQSAVEACHSLPWERYVSPSHRKTAKRWLITVGCVFTLSLLLPFGAVAQRVGRITLPWANLGRASSVRIDLLSPSRMDQTVPIGEPIVVVAQFSSNWSGDATLQIFNRSGSIEHVPMLAADNEAMVAAANHWSDRGVLGRGVLVPATEQLKFRVLADGAESPWYHLSAAKRPEATDLRLSVRPPAYAREASVLSLPLNSRTREVPILIGSSAELSFRVNEDAITAEALIKHDKKDTDKEARSIRIDRAAAGFRVPLDVVRVPTLVNLSLTNQDSGLSRQLLREIAIVPTPDRQAAIKWLEPTGLESLVSSRDLIQLRALVTDELPVERVALKLQRGTDQLESPSIVIQAVENRQRSEVRSELTAEMDLAEYKVSVGDRIEVQFFVVDLAGNETTSEPRTFIVRATEADAVDRDKQLKRVKLFRMLESLAEKATSLSKAADQPLPFVADFAQAIQVDCRAVEALLMQALDGETEPIDRFELQLLGEAIAELRRQLDVGFTADEIASSTLAASIDRQQLARDFANAAAVAGTVRDSFQSVMTGYGLRTIARNAQPIHDAQDRLHQQLAGSAVRAGQPVLTRLIRTQAVIVAQLEVLLADAEELAMVMSPIASKRLLGLLSSLSQSAALTGRETQKANIAGLRHNAAQLAVVLKMMANPLVVSPGLPALIADGYFPLITARHGLSEPAVYTSIRADHVRADHVLPIDSAQHVPGRASMAASLVARRRVVRAANLAIGQYSSDLGLASRALQLGKPEQHPWVQPVLSLLVAEYDLMLADSFLSKSAKRWQAGSVDSKATVICEALAMVIQSEAAISDARRLLGSKAVQELVVKMDPSSETLDVLKLLVVETSINRSIAQLTFEDVDALTRKKAQESELAEIESMQRSVRSAAERLLPIATAAREILSRLPPSLQSQAQDAAYQAQQLALASRDLSTEYSRDAVVNGQEQIANLNHVEQNLQRKLDTLRDSLVDVAERQNLLEQTEIARAQLADTARFEVDEASQLLGQSLNGISAQADPRETGPQLAYASGTQEDAANRLKVLAEALQQIDGAAVPEEASQKTIPDSDTRVSNAQNQVAQSPNHANTAVESTSGDGSQENPQSAQRQDYDDASRLAQLAKLSPAELLEFLEEELPRREPMQHALSDISKQELRQAAGLLRTNEARLLLGENELRNSDPLRVAYDAMQKAEADFEGSFSELLVFTIQQTQTAAKIAGAPQLGGRINSMKASVDRSRALEKDGGLTNKLTASATLIDTAELTKSIDAILKEIEHSAGESTTEPARATEEANASKTGSENLVSIREARDLARRTQQTLIKMVRRLLALRQQQVRTMQGEISQLPNRVSEGNAEGVDRSPSATSAAPNSGDNQPGSVALESLDRSRQAIENALPEFAHDFKLPPSSLNPAMSLVRELIESLKRQTELYEKARQRMGEAPEPRVYQAVLLKQRLSRQVLQSHEAAMNLIDRAARHEARLSNPLADQLNAIGAAHSLRHQQYSGLYKRIRERTASQDQVSLGSEDSRILLQACESWREQTGFAAEKIEQLLDTSAEDSFPRSQGSTKADLSNPAEAPENTPSPTAGPRSSLLPMGPEQLAQLLDELDQLINGQSSRSQSARGDHSLGESEDDSSGSKAASSGVSPDASSTLQNAARKLAQSLSSGRRPPPGKSQGDLGTATESENSDTAPQTASQYQIVDVARAGDNWGELTERTTKDASKSAEQSVAPKFQRHVDAYFERLSKQ